MGSFRMRLLITVNALVPIFCFFKCIQIIRLSPSNRDLLIDINLSLYMLLYSTRFLTNWALVIQLINMIGFFVHDLLKQMDAPKDYRSKLKFKMDNMFYQITSTANIFVTVAYWVLYIYDKELVRVRSPIVGHVSLPLWIDLLIHLLNSINICLHAWNDKKFTEQKNKYWPGVYYTLQYVSWIYFLDWIEELPIYPITDRMVEPYRLCFWLGICFLSPLPKNIVYSIGRKFYMSRNVKDHPEIEKEK